MIRQAEMHRELRELQLPPRWAGYLNHGYGYPLFLFTYPLPYIVGEIFMVLRLGVITTVKLLFFLATFLSLTTMYLFIRRLWGNSSAYISVILFAYAPYRITNIFLRGSLGELWAFVFYPLLFLAYRELIKDPSRGKILICSVVTALFLLSHNASVVIFLPFLVVWVFLTWWLDKFNWRKISATLVSGVIGIGLSAWFWLPAIAEKKFVILSILPLADKAQHFLTLRHLFAGQFHENTGLLLTVGNLYLGLAIFALVAGIILKRQKFVVLFLFLTAFVSILMTQRISAQFWQIPLFREIDFPWRSLGIAIFGLSAVGGILGDLKYGKMITIGIMLVLYFTQLPVVYQAKLVDKSAAYFETNDATTTSADELMPIWVTNKPAQRPVSLIQTAGIDANTVYETGHQMQIEINTATAQDITVNQVYFPGWKVYTDMKEIPVRPTAETGLISFVSRPGRHIYNMRFERTLVRKISDSLSIISLILMVSVWTFSKKLSHI